MSLFGGLEEQGIEFETFKLAGSDAEFSAREIQQFEKEFLGFYVTSHPLSSIRDKLPFLMTHKISELKNLPTDKPVTICGLITTARKIATKKDPSKFIKFATIEDLSGKIEVVCFPKQVAQFDSLLDSEQRVIVSGKISRRDENDENAVSLVVDNVKTIDNSNILNIRILSDMKFEELMYLRGFLTQNKGDDPVTISVTDETGDLKILSGSNFWVKTTNDLVNTLKTKFADKVEINIKSMDDKLTV